jgi:hypothetical protein
MSSIRASIIIDLPDGIDYNTYIKTIKDQVSNITGLETVISIREVDDPISINPVNIDKIKE